MIPFNRKATKPLMFERDELAKYVNHNRLKQDSLQDFIHLTNEQKKIFLNIPSKIASKIKLPRYISIEQAAYYFSQEINPDKRKENNKFERLAKYMINRTEVVPFPKGVRISGIQPVISYKESYKPILFQEKFIGGVYEIFLENQFPRIVSTEEIFAHNERINAYINYILDELFEAKERNDDFPVADLFGSAYNETTCIRTIPEISILNSFIVEHFVAKDYEATFTQYQNHTF